MREIINRFGMNDKGEYLTPYEFLLNISKEFNEEIGSDVEEGSKDIGSGR